MESPTLEEWDIFGDRSDLGVGSLHGVCCMLNTGNWNIVTGHDVSLGLSKLNIRH